MAEYSVAEAKAKLSELLERAEKGEAVTITRHGKAVAQVNPIAPAPKRMTQADLYWLAERRKTRKVRGDVSPVQLLMKMRDER